MSKKLADRLNAFVKEVEELEKTDQFDEDGFSKHFRVSMVYRCTTGVVVAVKPHGT